LQIDDAEFPFPLVERAERVEKLLLAMKSEVAELLGADLALETVKLLTLDLEREADAAIRTPGRCRRKSVRSRESGAVTKRMTTGG